MEFFALQENTSCKAKAPHGCAPRGEVGYAPHTARARKNRERFFVLRKGFDGKERGKSNGESNSAASFI